MSDLGLYRGLGSELISRGKWFLNKATPVSKISYFRKEIVNAISAATGLPVERIYSADEYHHCTNIETWKTLITDDWSNKKKYVAELYDCDNFAGSFSANMAEVYELNSAARVTVELKDPISGKHIGWHRCCILVTSDLSCWLLETQTDKILKIETGKPAVIDNWEYKFISSELN